MKNLTNISLAGRGFTLEDDAYLRLNQYLEHYRIRLSDPELQKGEVMDEIESRIAEIFYQEIGESNRVITLPVVEKMASTLGMPDGSAERVYTSQESGEKALRPKKLFRNPDEKSIAGVCSGIAVYFDVDITLVRIVMLIALLAGSAGFWVYVIFWIAVPVADTPAKKCEMYGLEPTADNLARFARGAKRP